MSTQIIILDKERTLVYDWDALLLLEKLLGVKGPMQITRAAAEMGYGTLLHFLRAGLVHGDKSLTDAKIRELVTQHATLADAGPVLWPAIIQALTEDLGLRRKDDGDAGNGQSPATVEN